MMESSQSSSSSSSRISEKSNFNYPLGLNMGSSWESGWSPAFNSEDKDDSCSKIVMRRFSKTFTLPARVKEEEISSN